MLLRLAVLLSWNRFLGLLKSLKIQAQTYRRMEVGQSTVMFSLRDVGGRGARLKCGEGSCSSPLLFQGYVGGGGSGLTVVS